jgi:hypothetical protein
MNVVLHERGGHHRISDRKEVKPCLLLTLEDDLVATVDRAAGQRRQPCSAFTRETLHAALAKLEAQALEQQHR